MPPPDAHGTPPPADPALADPVPTGRAVPTAVATTHDRARAAGPELAVGVGMRPGATADSILAAVHAAAAGAPIACLATVDRRATDPGLEEAAAHLGVPVVAYTPTQLAEVEVPTPSPRTAHALGSPSVCEAAALLASGATQVHVPKLQVAGVTAATAVMHHP
ncbi:cobalamin biosynthesis protein [Nocardia sp. NPDC003693]